MEQVQKFMNIGKNRILLALLFAMALSGCDELFPDEDDGSGFFLEETTKEEDAIIVTNTEFSPDYKTFCLTTEKVRDIGPFSLADTNSVRVRVKETANGISVGSQSLPELTAAVNVEGDMIIAEKVKMMALVDLTLPQELIDVERQKVMEAASSFTHRNLFVCFMYGDHLSETLPASDYVFDNYFVQADSDYKQLYRSILTKRDEMLNHEGVWADAKEMLLLVMSDGKVYFSDDRPMDPQHYQLQEQMIQTDVPADNRLIVEYVNMAPGTSMGDEENVLKVFSRYYNGEFRQNFSWVDIRKQLDKVTHIDFVDNKFFFTNPDFKLYRGDTHKLTLEFYSVATDSLVASVSTKIKLGSVYDPIIVNGHSLRYVVAQGIAIGLFLMLLAYLVYQFAIPYIRYRRFLKKYVVSFSNANRSVNGIMVGQSCYLCKAPYMEGDKVVVKCEHTMHKSCWDENNYHCPEYSDHCKHGSHYYNHVNRFDPQNASFYMCWVLEAIGSAILAWTCFTLGIYHVVGSVQRWMAANVFGTEDSTSELMNAFEETGVNVFQMPSFGLTIGFFLTLTMTLLTTWHRRMRFKWLSALLKAVMVSVASFLAFLLTSQFVALIGAAEYDVFFDWIPWLFMGFLIAYTATYGTRIRIHKWLLFLAVLLGILSMYLWSSLFHENFYDYRVLLLLSYIFFSVGIALCIASRMPHSNHYYLQVSGAIKKMDIALYKWFRGNAGGVVTIGRSIDCNLQLSWDTVGVIAPVQAELRCQGDSVRLYAVEEGVYLKNSKPLEVGKAVHLYHGDSFEIGRTTFTYIEKDI